MYLMPGSHPTPRLNSPRQQREAQMLQRCKGCKNVLAKEATKCPECGIMVPKPSNTGKIIFLIFSGLMVLGFLLPEAPQPAPKPAAAPPPKSNAQVATKASPQRLSNEEVFQRVSISKFSWAKDGFNTVMLATLTIQNKSNRPIKDVQLTCRHSGNSGTKIDESKKVIYEVVGPNASRTFKNFNMGFIHPQATRSNCEIAGLSVL
jgi:hypothetical protein